MKKSTVKDILKSIFFSVFLVFVVYINRFFIAAPDSIIEYFTTTPDILLEYSTLGAGMLGILLSFAIGNKAVSLFLCYLLSAAAIVISPMSIYLILPLTVAFCGARFDVFKLKNKSDKYFVSMIFSLDIFAFLTGILTKNLSILLIEYFVPETTFKVIAAFAVSLLIFLISIPILKKSIPESSKKAEVAMMTIMLIGIVLCGISVLSFGTYRNFTEKEFVSMLGYIILALYILRKSDAAKKITNIISW